MRRMILDATYNTRDIGGYPLNGGGETAYGRFIRSDVPFKLSEKDMQKIKNFGIEAVIDLRTEEEAKRRISSLYNVKGIKYCNFSLIGRNSIPKNPEDVAPSYFNMISTGEAVKSVFKQIFDCEKAVLFNCTAGKDRTGVISALLLLLAGARKEDIVADYMLSYSYLYDVIKKYENDNPDAAAYIVEPQPKYILGFLERFNDSFGTAENYFSVMGFGEDKVKALKNRLRA